MYFLAASSPALAFRSGRSFCTAISACSVWENLISEETARELGVTWAELGVCISGNRVLESQPCCWVLFTVKWEWGWGCYTRAGFRAGAAWVTAKICIVCLSTGPGC